MDKAGKRKFVDELIRRAENSQGSVIVGYQGLRVKELEELRREIKKVPADCFVIKNSLAKLAVKTKNSLKKWEGLVSSLSGPKMLAINYGDVVKMVKILVDFANKHENLKIERGLVEGRILPAEDLKLLAALPSREVLLNRLLLGLSLPLRRLMGIANSSVGRLLVVLTEISKKKEGEMAK